MSEDSFLIIGLGSGVVMLGLFFILKLVMDRISGRWNKHRAETVGAWEAEGVEFVLGPTGAQFGGLESQRLSRARGLGFVALTDRDFRITRATPSAEWHLSFKQIKGVTLQPAFNGKRSSKTPFIVIRFIQDGQKERLGFQVKEYESWAEQIAQAARVSLREKT